MVACIRRWKVAGADSRPIGILVYSYKPKGVVNAVLCWSRGSMEIWWYPLARSKVLQASHARALKHLQEAAAERRKQTDQKAADHPLHVGDLVYLRNRVLGRSKIQDRWRPELHVVTARPYPGIHVYGVKPFSGGQERTLSRDDLLPARAPLAAAAEEPTRESPAQANPQYPDRGVSSGWVGL